MKPKPWDRKAWGVEMRSPKTKPMLISEAWHKVFPLGYEGEPTRCLLFCTRIRAKQWCEAKTIEYAKYANGWSFKPVRVRETVTPI